MLAESQGPDPLGSGAPWTSSTGNDIKDQGSRHRQQGRQHLQQKSSKRSCFFGLETRPELVWEDWDLGKEFTKTLVLKNIYSKLQKLHLRPPVSKFFTTIIPQIIVLSPGTSFSIPIIFKPLQRYEDSIEFQSNDGSFQVCLRATIPCHALEVPDSVLLPICAVEHSSHTTFRLKNTSKLQTWFEWVCAAPYQLSPEQGLLKPHQECYITVVFRPQEALVYQQHVYCKFGEEGYEAEGSCTVLLQGLGTTTSSCPRVSLSSFVVDFGCVKEGETISQTLELVNSSPVEAIYQWDLDCNGHSVFSIHPASGTVCPHSHTTVRAVYRPTQPIAHHRRVACLILHREPLLLDLIGTCHSELQQPVILRPEHLILYKLHWNRRQDPPDTRSSMQQVHLDQQGICATLEESIQRPAAVVPISPMEEFYQSCLGFMDPLSSSSSLSSTHVSVVPSELLFNHKILVWTVAQDSPFTVSPLSCDLAPLKSTSFRVTYSPKQLNTLHGAQLECFAFYKDNHIGEPLLCPPWCVTVRVIGHSFQLGKEHFIPCCSLKPPIVVFPALSVLSYRTVLLQNSGDLPLIFCPDQSSNSAMAETVSVIPNCGIIQPGDHQILTLRTTSTEESPKQGFIVSVAEKPCVSLERDSSLYFQPTAVGSQTHRSHQIRNLSRLPLRFQWSIPESDEGIISVEPGVGELMHACTVIVIRKLTIYIWGIHMLNQMLYTSSSSQAEKAVMDFGETLVGSYRSIEIPLVNNSPCPVTFCLSVEQRLLEDDVIYDPETEPSGIPLCCIFRATIAPQCTMLLRSTVRPQRRAKYLWTISYQTLNSRGVSSSPQAVCEVRARGVFPTLQVIDVCSGGRMGRLSKEHLWKLFSLDSLNKHLLSDPSSSELTYRTPTRHSLRSYPSIFTKTILDFNFSAAPLNSEPSTFVLMFHNSGSISVDWTFLFPEDQQIELEYWAETGELDSAELCQMKVQDNHLFSISPRSGTLHPGQQRAVHFTYSHTFVGTDRFPVVFKLSYGREILLNFQGVTVERERPYLHFASNQHVFTSVTIGHSSPPMQVYELHNAGAVPVHYEVDAAVLSQLQMDNFNHPVLCCLNPEGEVLPGKLVTLEWIFSPLEAKMYHMDIPIHIQDGDSTLVRFEGCGIDCRTPGSNSFYYSDSKPSVLRVQRMSFPGQVSKNIMYMCFLFIFLSFSLCRNILDDSAFTQSLITLVSKPIIYQPAGTSPSYCPSVSSSSDLPDSSTSSHHKPEPQVGLSGTESIEARLNEDDNAVDRDGTAGRLTNKPQTQNTLRPEYVPASMAEDVLLNTLQNLMMEAVSGELVLTAHPRTVILPPVSAR
uniref:Uncharacterized protein n=1 Tax=Anabas testudineus TaxID=64144 RepID=A0A3Q1HG52_ANATE